MPSFLTTTIFDIPSHVAGKVMDGELVVINLTSGLYYAAPGVGARIWQLLERGKTAEQIAAILASVYAVPMAEITRDVGDFIALLAERGLIDARTSDEPGAGADDTADLIGLWQPETYAPPSLQAFDDMAQAFAIDPPLGVGRQR